MKFTIVTETEANTKFTSVSYQSFFNYIRKDVLKNAKYHFDYGDYFSKYETYNREGALAHYNEALKYYDEVIKFSPNSVVGYCNKVLVLMRLGRYDDVCYNDAMDCLQDVARINPEYNQHNIKSPFMDLLLLLLNHDRVDFSKKEELIDIIDEATSTLVFEKKTRSIKDVNILIKLIDKFTDDANHIKNGIVTDHIASLCGRIMKAQDISNDSQNLLRNILIKIVRIEPDAITNDLMLGIFQQSFFAKANVTYEEILEHIRLNSLELERLERLDKVLELDPDNMQAYHQKAEILNRIELERIIQELAQLRQLQNTEGNDKIFTMEEVEYVNPLPNYSSIIKGLVDSGWAFNNNGEIQELKQSLQLQNTEGDYGISAMEEVEYVNPLPDYPNIIKGLVDSGREFNNTEYLYDILGNTSESIV